jgi:hypothetical protein
LKGNYMVWSKILFLNCISLDFGMVPNIYNIQWNLAYWDLKGP